MYIQKEEKISARCSLFLLFIWKRDWESQCMAL